MSLIHRKETVSPARLLEMLSDRFGAFEAIAYSTIKLARHVSGDELSMDLLVAEAILEFGNDLRAAIFDNGRKRWQRNAPELTRSNEIHLQGT